MKHTNLISSLALLTFFSATLLFSTTELEAANNTTSLTGKAPHKYFTMPVRSMLAGFFIIYE